MDKVNQATRVLKRLKQGRATNIELNRICFRYSSRIFELRKEGHNIQRQYVRPGVFEYWITGQNTTPER